MKNDVEYWCDVILRLGSRVAFSCILPRGHDGPHRDEFEHEGKSVVVTWQDAGDSAEPVTDDEHLPLTRQPEAPVSSIVAQATEKYTGRDISAHAFFGF